MIRAALLALAACVALSACGVDGEPVPPTRALHTGPAAAF